MSKNLIVRTASTSALPTIWNGYVEEFNRANKTWIDEAWNEKSTDILTSINAWTVSATINGKLSTRLHQRDNDKLFSSVYLLILLER